VDRAVAPLLGPDATSIWTTSVECDGLIVERQFRRLKVLLTSPPFEIFIYEMI
jgi:hypothetical protein